MTAEGRRARVAIEAATDARGVPPVVSEAQVDAAVAALAPLADLALPSSPPATPSGSRAGGGVARQPSGGGGARGWPLQPMPAPGRYVALNWSFVLLPSGNVIVRVVVTTLH